MCVIKKPPREHDEKQRKLKHWIQRLKNRTGKEGSESAASDGDESTQGRLPSHTAKTGDGKN
jgi:hypothetical protein